jgi:hypothetical protein
LFIGNVVGDVNEIDSSYNFEAVRPTCFITPIANRNAKDKLFQTGRGKAKAFRQEAEGLQ